VVHPAAGRADLGGNGVDKSGHVVLGLPLELGDLLRRRRLRARANLGHCLLRHAAELRPRFERGELDV
jgi:hypothetical protein